MTGIALEKDKPTVIPQEVDVGAYVSQLGDQDGHSVIPEIIVLEKGKPAQFIPVEQPAVKAA